MNLPNQLTFARLVLCGVLLVGLEWEWMWRGSLAFVIFGVASLTDWLDGFLARRWNQHTDLGKLLDPLADKVLVSIAYIALVQHDLAPLWMVACLIAREFLITGLRTLAAAKGVIMKAEVWGKHKTVCQIATAMLGLLILALRDLQTATVLRQTLEQWILWPLILVTFLVTVYSGIAYFVKNKQLVVQSL